MKKYFSVLIVFMYVLSVGMICANADDNVFTMDFEDLIIKGVSYGERISRPDVEDGYCLSVGSNVNNTSSVLQMTSKSGIVSVGFDLYFVNNTNGFCMTLRDSGDNSLAKLRTFNQETMVAYDSPSSVCSLSNVTEPKTWHNYRFLLDTVNQKYLVYIDNVPIYTKWFDFNSSGSDVKNIYLEVSKGSYVYMDNLKEYTCSDFECTVSSSSYTVDNEYKMITGIDRNVTVGDFLNNISVSASKYVSDKLGKMKSEGVLEVGDSLCITDTVSEEFYALGFEDCENNLSYIQNKFSPALSSGTLKVYISPDGSDLNNGRRYTQPFKTFQKCMELISQSKDSMAGDVVIYMLPGNYEINESADFGSKLNLGGQRRLIIMPYSDGAVTVTGGKTLLSSDFSAVEDSSILSRLNSSIKNNVKVCDLSSIDSSYFGNKVQSGWNLGFVNGEMQLYKNGVLQTLARYPDNGFVKSSSIVNPDKAFYFTGGSEYGKFVYSDTRIESWAEPQKAWIWSHFGVSYGGHDIKIGNVDIPNKTITVANSYYTSPKSNFSYYYTNVLEELDKPGEWYFDNTTSKLYYYPENEIADGELSVSFCKDDLLRFSGIDNVYIKNIDFMCSRGDILSFSDCNNVLLENCRLSGAGMNGVEFCGGSRNVAYKCDIGNTGGDAIKLYGGNIYTLSSSLHGVYECKLHDFSQRKNAYTGGATLAGVGIEVENCQIYDGPHLGIYLRGNNFKIKNNCFYNLVHNAKDMGAIYTYNNYVWRGSEISGNYFENIRSDFDYGETNLAKGIYLDNFSSGYTVENNIFYDCDEGVHANGGRNNVIVNNVFENTELSVRAPYVTMFEPPYDTLESMPYKSDLWKNTYSNIEDTSDLHGGYPVNTHIGDNFVAGMSSASIADKKYMLLSDNIFEATNYYNSLDSFMNLKNSNISSGIYDESCNDISRIFAFNGEDIVSGTYIMHKGDMTNFSCVLKGKTGYKNDGASFVSENDEIASVTSSGTVNAIKCGTVTIKVTYNDIISSFKIKVIE